MPHDSKIQFVQRPVAWERRRQQSGGRGQINRLVKAMDPHRYRLELKREWLTPLADPEAARL